MKMLGNLYCAEADVAGIHFKVFTSHKGIRNIFMNEKSAEMNDYNVIRLQSDDPYMYNVFHELTEYFNLERKKFELPLDAIGTDFQINVWKELKKIPYGELVTYKIIAERVGNTKSVRAVGRALGANPIPVIVPCHRVITSSGDLGGYSCGSGIKEKLLELEGCLSLQLFNN